MSWKKELEDGSWKIGVRSSIFDLRPTARLRRGLRHAAQASSSDLRASPLLRRGLRPAVAFGEGGFTLTEMLISVVLLAFVVLFVSRLVNSAATITTLGTKRMDADSQARQLLDRMAIDFDQMLKRTDVSYYIKAGSTGAAMTGNDRIAFFSAVPGNLASIQSSYQSNISLVAYRVNADSTASSYNKVERMGKGLNLNGAYTGAITPLVFLDAGPTSIPGPTTTIASIWLAATSATDPDSPYFNWEVLGPQVFRLEYYFLLTPDPATGLARGFSTGSQWTSTNTFVVKDVAAIVVAIAAIDPRSRAILTNAQITTLIGRLPDYAATMGPGGLLAAWQTALDGANTMPRQAIQGVRLYERYFYLNQ